MLISPAFLLFFCCFCSNLLVSSLVNTGGNVNQSNALIETLFGFNNETFQNEVLLNNSFAETSAYQPVENVSHHIPSEINQTNQVTGDGEKLISNVSFITLEGDVLNLTENVLNETLREKVPVVLYSAGSTNNHYDLSSSASDVTNVTEETVRNVTEKQNFSFDATTKTVGASTVTLLGVTLFNNFTAENLSTVDSIERKINNFTTTSSSKNILFDDPYINKALFSALVAVAILAVVSLCFIFAWKRWRSQLSGEWVLNKNSRPKSRAAVVGFENECYAADYKRSPADNSTSFTYARPVYGELKADGSLGHNQQTRSYDGTDQAEMIEMIQKDSSAVGEELEQ